MSGTNFMDRRVLPIDKPMLWGCPWLQGHRDECDFSGANGLRNAILSAFFPSILSIPARASGLPLVDFPEEARRCCHPGLCSKPKRADYKLSS